MAKIEKKEWIRTLKFLLFSISAGIVQMGSFALMSIFLDDTYYRLKSYIAITLSVVWNFTINRKLTFKSANNVKIAMLKTLCFYIVFAPLSIELGDLYLVKTLGWNEFIVMFCSMIINFVTEFLYQRFFVYGKSVDTAVKKNKKKEQVNNEQKIG